MDAPALTPEQAAPVGESIRRHLRYLGRLRTRLERIGVGGPLYDEVCAAYNATHKLSVSLHYLTCKPGTVARDD